MTRRLNEADSEGHYRATNFRCVHTLIAESESTCVTGACMSSSGHASNGPADFDTDKPCVVYLIPLIALASSIKHCLKDLSSNFAVEKWPLGGPPFTRQLLVAHGRGLPRRLSLSLL
jgi:hypothetical protein